LLKHFSSCHLKISIKNFKIDTTRTHLKEFEAFYVNTHTTRLPSTS
jgi:hypothetical protein